MNEKFFDLKQEKQDRMINAALKIFAKNGYKHASTDEIVSEASISKGLLFHYFGSKQGLYDFLYDYSVRFLMLETKSLVPETETDYFRIMKLLEQAKMQVGKNYPYLKMFLETAVGEDDAEAVAVMEEKRLALQNMYDGFLERIDQKRFRPDIDIRKLHNMMTYTLRGIMEEHLENQTFQNERLYDESCSYIDMMKAMAYA